MAGYFITPGMHGPATIQHQSALCKSLALSQILSFNQTSTLCYDPYITSHATISLQESEAAKSQSNANG